MNLKDMLLKQIAECGADGLCNTDIGCGCGIADLMPCTSPAFDCETAKARTLSADEHLGDFGPGTTLFTPHDTRHG